MLRLAGEIWNCFLFHSPKRLINLLVLIPAKVVHEKIMSVREN